MRRHTITILLTVGLLAGCSGGNGGNDRLAENLDAVEQAQDALRRRVSTIEDQFEAARSQDTASNMLELSAQVADLRTALDELTARVDGAGDDEDLAAALRVEIGKVSDQVADVARTVASLAAELQTLEDAQEQLRQDLDAHARDPDAHP
jgi:outer membrane murein-binding lipoprotein Lpp